MDESGSRKQRVMKWYDTLLRFPFFQGMNETELAEIATKTKFDFINVSPKQYIISKGTTCNQLLLLSDGEVLVSQKDANGTCLLKERICQPLAIQPERLFGLNQNYTLTVQALSKCSLLALNKQEVLKLLSHYMLFQFNMLNFLSTSAQRYRQLLWNTKPQGVQYKIILFILNRCLTTNGYKDIKIRLYDLASEISESRLNVSKALHEMQGKGLLQMKRLHILVDDLEKLSHYADELASN